MMAMTSTSLQITFFIIKTYVDGLFSVQIICILRWGLSQNKLLNKVILLSVSGWNLISADRLEPSTAPFRQV